MEHLPQASYGSRLADLVRSLPAYELLSNGLTDDIAAFLPINPEEVERFDDARVAEALANVVRVLQMRRLEPVLALHGLPYPRISMGETPEDPHYQGPTGVSMWETPTTNLPSSGWNVLGRDVGFPVGIPACDLTQNADWIEYYGRMGFHVLTYRTVRMQARPHRQHHRWAFVQGIDDPWPASFRPKEIRLDQALVPEDWRSVSTAVSLELPSPEPEVWSTDIADARRRLDHMGSHYLLIVSVASSNRQAHLDRASVVNDFVAVARRAEASGAHAIECYLALALVRDDRGRVVPCEADMDASLSIVRTIRTSLQPNTRLLIKLSGDLSARALEQLVVPLAADYQIDGVSGVSPASVDRVTAGPKGEHVWVDRNVGVAGYALRDRAKSFVEALSEIRRTHDLDFDIISSGGVLTAADVASHLRLGAAAVQCATAAIGNPGLATEAYLHFRGSVETVARMVGMVEEVDEQSQLFRARMSSASGELREEEVAFSFADVRSDHWARIRPGAMLDWSTTLSEERGDIVRRSVVRIRRPREPSRDVVKRPGRQGDADAAVSTAWPDPNASMDLRTAHVESFRSGPSPGDADVEARGVSVGGPPIPISIFLCHSSSDKPVVRELYRQLLQDGFKPWLDEEEILGGQDWETEISRAVRAADLILICLSGRSVTKRGFVQKEIRFALDVADQQPPDRIFLIPFRLEECEVPYRLRNVQWVDYFKPNGYSQLLKALVFAASSVRRDADG